MGRPVKVPGLRVPVRRQQRIILMPPPSLNAIYRLGRNDEGNCIMFLAPEVKAWKDGQAQMLAFLKPVPAPREVRLEVLWLLAKGDKGDCDNRLKVLQDALEGHGYDNDSQIAELHVYRVRDQKWSRMEIMVEDMSVHERHAATEKEEPT